MIFNFSKNLSDNIDINKGVDMFLNDDNGVLVDVRSYIEYKSGHIKNSINIPVEDIPSANLDRHKNLYLYCVSGARSQFAVNYLKSNGYENVVNIGGITGYSGKFEF